MDKKRRNLLLGAADELCSWVLFGGGQALWDEVNAQFNIKPLMAFNSGVQMGGWFNKEINGPEDYKGLRYRMPGLGDGDLDDPHPAARRRQARSDYSDHE